MKLTFLGTGDEKQVPVYGCQCKACQRARLISSYIRRPACALLQHGETKIMLDAGLTDLSQRFSPGDLDALLLTHFDLDHIQGLFHFRWGLNDCLPVYCPADPQAANLLMNDPGMLDFHDNIQAFKLFQLNDLSITPVPLQYHCPTFGYCIQTHAQKIAYLTDTRELPQNSSHFLLQWQPDVLIIDCTNPPDVSDHRYHNDFDQVTSIVKEIRPEVTYLTHISHAMDLFLIEHFYRLPLNINVAVDQLTIRLDDMARSEQSKLGS